jgi:hypothetical protein
LSLDSEPESRFRRCPAAWPGTPRCATISLERLLPPLFLPSFFASSLPPLASLRESRGGPSGPFHSGLFFGGKARSFLQLSAGPWRARAFLPSAASPSQAAGRHRLADPLSRDTRQRQPESAPAAGASPHPMPALRPDRAALKPRLTRRTPHKRFAPAVAGSPAGTAPAFRRP